MGNLAFQVPVDARANRAELSVGDTMEAGATAPGLSQVAPRPVLRPGREVTRNWLTAPVVSILLISLFPLAFTLVVGLRTTPDVLLAVSGDARLLGAAHRTLIIAAFALPIELALGLGLTLVFAGRMPGKGIFVSLLAIPALLAPVTAGTAWRMLFDNDYGPVNQVLGWITGRAVVSLWTTDAALVVPAIVIADVWQWTPFMFVLFMAALSGIGRDQRELAEIDDAGPWRMVFRVILPALWPGVAVALLVRAIDLLRMFDMVWALTRGGPDHQSETLSLTLYGRLLDGAHQAGTAAIAFVGILAFSLVAMPFLMRLGRAR